MSDLVLPKLPGRKAERSRTPIHKTHVVESVSGDEYRWRQSLYPRYAYRQAYDVLRQGRFTSDELETLLGFFNQHGGRADSWLYDDPEDNTATAQPFGAGDGVTQQFKLVRTLGGFAEPVHAFASAKIYVNGVLANLVVNGGFVATALPWALGSGTHTAAVNNAGFAGLQLTNATGGADSFHAQVFPCAPSTTYTVTAKLFVDSVIAGAIENRSLLLTDGVGAVAGDYTLAPGHTTGVFVDKTVTITTGPSASLLQVRLYAPRGVVYWDEVRAAEGSAVPTLQTDMGATLDRKIASVTLTPAPAAAVLLSWSGSYFWRCRFQQDQTEFKRLMGRLWQAGSWDFITVKPRG